MRYLKLSGSRMQANAPKASVKSGSKMNSFVS
jgi:hypothetical protein